MKSVIAFTALLAAGPAFAVTVPGASLTNRSQLYLNNTMSFGDFVGPLGSKVSSRTGTATGLSDYGRYKSTMKGRIFSLADGMPNNLLTSFSESVSIDTVTIADSSGDDRFTAEFRVRVKANVTDRTTGFSSAVGTNVASWSFGLSDEESGDFAAIAGDVRLTDTPRTAPLPGYSVRSLTGPDTTLIASGATLPTGFQTYSFTTRLRNFSTFSITAGTLCFSILSSARINDTVNNSCGIELQLDGFTLFDPEGAPYAPGATTLRSISGYDYRQPYFAPPPVSARAFAIAAAVPEPGTWLLMIAGFGAVGIASRRQRPATRRGVTP